MGFCGGVGDMILTASFTVKTVIVGRKAMQKRAVNASYWDVHPVPRLWKMLALQILITCSMAFLASVGPGGEGERHEGHKGHKGHEEQVIWRRTDA